MTAYRPEIERAAQEHGIDPDLLEAIVMTESSGIASATRYERDFWVKYLLPDPRYRYQIADRVSRSYGLCQVMYPTAVDHGFKAEPEYLFVPRVNLDMGATILRRLLDWSDTNVERACRAYNGGKGGVDKPITLDYWRKVSANLEALRKAKH